MTDPTCPNCGHSPAWTHCWKCGWSPDNDPPPAKGQAVPVEPEPVEVRAPDDLAPRFVTIPWDELVSVNRRTGGIAGFTSKAWQEGLKAARARVSGAVRAEGWTPIVGPARVDLYFLVPDLRRRDVPNLVKLILDALEGSKDAPGIYVDDTQAVEGGWRKMGVDRERPCVNVYVTPLGVKEAAA